MSHDDHTSDAAHELLRGMLDDYVDGTLSTSQRPRVEAHVRDCVACRAEVESLHALVDAARSLPATLDPTNDFWPDLKKRIRQRPVAVVASGRSSRATVHSVRESPRWVFGGVAAAAVIIALAAMAWLAARDAGMSGRNGDPAHRIASTRHEDAFPAVVRGLEIECKGAGKMLQASLTYDDERGQSIAASVREGVEVLDRSIAETRAALEKHPNDAQLMKQLTMRYHQKLDLLFGAMRLAENV